MGVHDVRRARQLLAAVLLAALIAACRYLPPGGAPDATSNPLPDASGAPRVSPSLEVPPPVD
jgi:hypothetical protein